MKKCVNGKYIEMTQEEIARMQFEQKETEKEYYQSMSYGELVNLFVRERYSLSEEIALGKQKERKPEEHQRYDDYCEECKVRAKRVLGIKG